MAKVDFEICKCEEEENSDRIVIGNDDIELFLSEKDAVYVAKALNSIMAVRFNKSVLKGKVS